MPSHAYAPYRPILAPKPVAEDVWIVDGPEIRFGFFGVRLPFPTRMTIVRLPDGDLWLHSPVEPADALVDAVLRLGHVRWLVAPNRLHYWWLPDWKARFPRAEIYAAPGVGDGAKRRLPAMHPLAQLPPPAWGGAFEQVTVASRVLTEVCFLHCASRTLILADLIENFELRRLRHWFHRLLVRLGGVADPDGKTPADLRRGFRRNRPAVEAAVRKMIAWAPERIVIAHGRWYEGHAAAELRRAFRWLLRDRPGTNR
jgi:hypothetical protein